MPNLLTQRRIVTRYADPLAGFVDTHFLPGAYRTSQQTGSREVSVDRKPITYVSTNGLSDTVVLAGASSFSNETTGGRIYCPLTGKYNFVTDPWCVEGWFYPTINTAAQKLFLAVSASDSATNLFVGWNSSTLALWSDTIAGATFGISLASYINKWMHVAVTRDARRVRIYLDGILLNTFSLGTDSFGTGAGSLTLFGNRPNTSSNVMGYCAEAKVTLGHCRYNSNFTPQIPVIP